MLARKPEEVNVKPRNKAKRVKTETKTEPPKGGSASAAPAKQEAAPARPQKIKVLKKDTKYRGAREVWFQRLMEYDGKTEGEFIESAKAKPPALTKNGSAENPTGWIRFFVRTGVMSLQA